MTPEEYHASDGLSNSMMNKLLKSPAHMKYYMDNPDPSTPAQVLGTQAHTALLEPVRKTSSNQTHSTRSKAL